MLREEWDLSKRRSNRRCPLKQAEEKLKKIAFLHLKNTKNLLRKSLTEAALEIGGGEVIVHLKAEDVDKIKDSIASIEKDVER